MRDSFLVHNEDMMNKNHSPVITFFALASRNKEFIHIIPYFAQGVGYGYEFAVCTFPGDLDEYALSQGEGFDGVEFSLDNGEAVVLSYEEFYYYLHLTSMRYLEKHPEDRALVMSVLQQVRERYQIQG